MAQSPEEFKTACIAITARIATIRYNLDKLITDTDRVMGAYAMSIVDLMGEGRANDDILEFLARKGTTKPGRR